MKKTKEINTSWYKSYGHIPPHLEYPDNSIWELIQDTASTYPKNITYDYFGTTINYTEFMKKIRECAKAFKALGIKQKDRVTICMPNTPEAVISFYALNMIGAIANMIHPLSAENEMKFYLNFSESKIMLAIDISCEKINNIINETKLEKVIIASAKDSMPNLTGIGYWLLQGRKTKKIQNSKFIYYKDFIKQGEDWDQSYEIKGKGNDPAVILYSGGTTGEPKGILLSNLNFNSLAIQGLTMCDCIVSTDSILSIMPIFHGFGLGVCIHTALYAGAKAILLPQFSVKNFHKLLIKYKPNVMAGVPTLYEALLRNKHMDKIDLSHLKCVISGGDSLSVSLKKKIDQFLKEHNSNIQIREGYGLTECVTGTCLTLKDTYIEGSMGIPYPDTYYKIVNPETHDELPFNETGEICLSGPTVMLGYINNPKETAHTLQTHNDGLVWLHTGDLGTMDENGFIYFKQRLKRMIISSGYNIYPQNIENVIDSHSDVLYSTVIGVKDSYKGQRVKAFVVLKDGIKPTDEVQDSIKQHCYMNIAKYAIPKEFEFRDSLPKTLVGKVAFNKLVEEEEKKTSN